MRSIDASIGSENVVLGRPLDVAFDVTITGVEKTPSAKGTMLSHQHSAERLSA